MEKYFTIQEANRTLPLVRQIVNDIIKYSIQASHIAETSNDIDENVELKELVSQVNSFIKELNEIGCYYKGFIDNFGLVDFPSKLDNQTVLLCWKSDEVEIIHYHSEEDGFKGRKLIPTEIAEKFGN